MCCLNSTPHETYTDLLSCYTVTANNAHVNHPLRFQDFFCLCCQRILSLGMNTIIRHSLAWKSAQVPQGAFIRCILHGFAAEEQNIAGSIFRVAPARRKKVPFLKMKAWKYAPLTERVYSSPNLNRKKVPKRYSNGQQICYNSKQVLSKSFHQKMLSAPVVAWPN